MPDDRIKHNWTGKTKHQLLAKPDILPLYVRALPRAYLVAPRLLSADQKSEAQEREWEDRSAPRPHIDQLHSLLRNMSLVQQPSHSSNNDASMSSDIASPDASGVSSSGRPNKKRRRGSSDVSIPVRPTLQPSQFETHDLFAAGRQKVIYIYSDEEVDE